MKKALSLLLAFAMLFSVVGAGTGIYALESVSEIYLINPEERDYIVSPLDGMHPCFELKNNYKGASVDTDYNTRPFVNGVSWKCTDNFQILSADDTFKEGKTYELTVRMVVDDGYVFNTKEGQLNVQAYIRQDIDKNGDLYTPATVESVDGSLDNEIIVSKTVVCPDIKSINEVTLNITPPSEGETPDANPTTALNYYYIDPLESVYFLNNLIRWENRTKSYMMGENSTFELGNTYRAYVRLRPSNGYEFSEETTTVKFGSKTATIESIANNFISAYVDYTLNEIVENVDMTVDVDYSAGKPALFFANSEEPEKYYSYEDYNADKFINGVCYKDVTNGEFMENGGLPFFKGHQYAITVAVNCSEAHKFAGLNVINASINGIDAVASSISPFGKKKEGVWFFTTSLGTCTKDINACNIVVSTRATYTYNGKAQKVVLSIFDGSETLVEGNDYEILYMGDHTNAGKAKYEISGLGEYSGSTKIKTFTIKKKSLTPKVNISAASYVYDGKVKKPTVKVYDGSKLLKNNTDYTYKYSASSPKSVNKYSITVTLKGNYSGSKTVNYSILPKGTSLLKTAATGKNYISPQWKKQTTQTTGYEIMYSTSGGFKKNNTTVKVTSNKTTVKKITGLKKNTKYYFKIRTYKKVKNGSRYTYIYSSWSSPKEFKTKK
ncbi:MAG: fibronectin type III domain-containing protein [Eubacterium sp.]|nr:fibronectin type III domain-containing protein [Eubacterium sp.]